MTARDEILSRVAAASAGAHAAPVVRDYRISGTAAPDGCDLTELLTERLADYGAEIIPCGRTDVAVSVERALATHRADRVLVPFGFPEHWLPRHVPIERDLPHLAADELDRIPAVLTTCAVAIAETGTVVLDGGVGMGRRALTLVPDVHILVVPSSGVVRGVPEAISALDATRPLTWISGPSATSDIELDRVEGVHGPRRLTVVLVD